MIETVYQSIEQRFDQEELTIYNSIKSVLLKSLKGTVNSTDPDFLSVTDFYGQDFSPSDLLAQLQLLTTTDHVSTASDLASCLKSRRDRRLFPEVEKLVSLLLTLPATNAVSERSFSVLRRLKTYLRSTMSQPRLNSLMLTHIHKDIKISTHDILSLYIQAKPGRSKRIACA